MKKPSRMKSVTRQLVATLLSLSMVILLTGVAQAALDCTQCHGNGTAPGTVPIVTGTDAHPIDTPAGSLPTFRVISTGAVKGNHNTHSVATTDPNVCAKCHGPAAVSYTAKHAVLKHYSIQMSPTVRYNKYTSAFSIYTSAFVTSFAQTPDPKLGRCSTANCHFETKTPIWGSDPLTGATINTCGTCHNALPASDSHSVHITEHGADLNACSYCHNDRRLDAKPFQHATSVGRAIAVNPWLTYSGSGSNHHYLPSQLADRTLGLCSTASCHDSGLLPDGQSQIDSPIWGTPVIKCDVCHSYQPVSGSHEPHRSGGALCGSCHKGAVKSSTVPVLHNNGFIDVFANNPGDLGYPPNKTKGSPYTTCTTAICHVNPSTGPGNVFKQMTSPVWGETSPPAKCTYCHDSRPATGSHNAHYDAGLAVCSNCHNSAVEGTTLPASHDNNAIDVYKTTSGDLGYPAAKPLNSAYNRCSTSSCHDDGRGNYVTSPVWGTSATNCTACHASKPTTGSHTQHLGGVGVTCGQCHKGAVQSTTAPALHMNGYVDVFAVTEGDMGYPAHKTKGSAFSSCTTVNCHGRLSPTWGSNTNNYQCTKCHGMGVTLANYSTSTYEQSAPGYMGVGIGVGRQTGIVTGNVSNDPKVGAHDTHLRSLNNIGKPAACGDCHNVPATAFVAGHMDGSSAPVWSNLVRNKETVPGSAIPFTFAKLSTAVSYNSGTGACSNTYCHGVTLTNGTNTAPKWNETGYLTGDRANDCSRCHGFPPSSPTNSGYLHDGVTSATNCSDCHPHNGTRDATSAIGSVPDQHMNGNIEANKYCNVCHDYDTRGTNGALWGKSQMAAESFGAHAMHINYLKKRMNVTTMNSNLDVYGSANFDGICGTCHSRDPNDHHQTERTTLVRHINFGSYSARMSRQFGPNAPAYNGETNVSSATKLKTCSNIDCHFKTSPIWQPF